MEALLPFALPIAFALWVLSPLSNWRSDEAKKTPVFATWPRESKGGNNPASQRVHEVGGFRTGALLTVAVQCAIGALGFELIGTAAAQFVAIPLVFVITRRFIDLAEHGAEIMHAQASGLPGYREAEALRMTSKGQEYERLTPGQFLSAADKKRWLSRIILKLGSW